VPIVTTSCLVLQTYRFGDTSKILRLLTSDFGPLSALARGALRPRSRMGGVLEPFVEGRATLYLKPNRDLHTLSGFELIRSRQSLGSDMARFAGASVLAELVLRLAPAQRDDRVYATLSSGLDVLEEAGAAAGPAVSLVRIWELIGVFGFEPALDLCLSCGRPIAAGEAASFVTAEGGLRCTDCGGGGRALPPHELSALRRLSGGAPVPDVSQLQVGLLKEFIRVHVAEDLRIRSLDFLEATDV
jgi:DNA repair protein RecO (recombination protein O)